MPSGYFIVVYKILQNGWRIVIYCMKNHRRPYGAGFVCHKGKDDSHKYAQNAHCCKSCKWIPEIFPAEIMADIGERPVPHAPYDSADDNCLSGAPKPYHLRHHVSTPAGFLAQSRKRSCDAGDDGGDRLYIHDCPFIGGKPQQLRVMGIKSIGGNEKR